MKSLFERPIESMVGLYAFAVGLMFLFDPHSLAAGVYAPWHELGRIGWACMLLGVSMMHFAALWLNGRNPRLSRPVRLTAVFIHLCISLQFAWMFYRGGAEWGSLTFGLLIPGLLGIIASRMMGRLLHGVVGDEL